VDVFWDTVYRTVTAAAQLIIQSYYVKPFRRFYKRKNFTLKHITGYKYNDNTRAGLSNVHSVHVHMRTHHIGGPTTRQT